ncbi:MAG: ferritin family protein, partial [Nitrospirota bacterium]|nr:ferritin family protein [Nitrospirota bacterium]
MRSRAAAAILSDSGFNNVFNMQGGIRAWEGVVAEGPPESGMAYFGDIVKPDELAMLAWMLEEGSRRFYVKLDEFLKDEEARQLFQSLAKAEESHEKTLAELYKTYSGGSSIEDKLPANRDEIMEGGVRVDESLLWARDKDIPSILEFAMSLETNSFDLYRKMGRRFEGDARKV